MPAFDPRMGKRPGGTAVKVWGILLLCLGLMGAMNLATSLAMSTGLSSPSNFAIGLTPEAKKTLDEKSAALLSQLRSSSVYWAAFGVECVLVGVSLTGGMLLLKSRPKAIRWCTTRAAIALLSIPLFGAQFGEIFETYRELQDVMMEAQMDSNPATKGNREAQKLMKPFMNIGMYAGLAVGGVFVIGFNSALAYMITRPAVKEYLANATPDVIPGYDPSMGLLGNPPGAAPPSQPQAPAPFSTLRNPPRG